MRRPASSSRSGNRDRCRGSATAFAPSYATQIQEERLGQLRPGQLRRFLEPPSCQREPQVMFLALGGLEGTRRWSASRWLRAGCAGGVIASRSRRESSDRRFDWARHRIVHRLRGRSRAQYHYWYRNGASAGSQRQSSARQERQGRPPPCGEKFEGHTTSLTRDATPGTQQPPDALRFHVIQPHRHNDEKHVNGESSMLRTDVPHIQWSRADCLWFRGKDPHVQVPFIS